MDRLRPNDLLQESECSSPSIYKLLINPFIIFLIQLQEWIHLVRGVVIFKFSKASITALLHMRLCHFQGIPRVALRVVLNKLHIFLCYRWKHLRFKIILQICLSDLVSSCSLLGDKWNLDDFDNAKLYVTYVWIELLYIIYYRRYIATSSTTWSTKPLHVADRW